MRWENAMRPLKQLGVLQEFGDSGHLVHSGVLASAEWLSDRLSCIAQVGL